MSSCSGRLPVIVMAAALAVANAGWSWWGSGHIPRDLLEDPSQHSVYFEADLPRVYRHVTDRGSNQDRSQLHPIFSLVTHTAYRLVRISGMEPLDCVRAVFAVAAGLYAGLAVLVGWVITRSVVMTGLIGALSVAASASMFWWLVPETFNLGSITVLCALLAAGVWGDAPRRGVAATAAVTALTASMSSSNAISGWALCFARHRRVRIVLALGMSFVMLFGVWLVQYGLFAQTKFFVPNVNETRYTFRPESLGMVPRITGLVWSPVILPALSLDSERYMRPPGRERSVITVQPGLPGSGSWAGLVAAMVWPVVAGLGLAGLVSGGRGFRAGWFGGVWRAVRSGRVAALFHAGRLRVLRAVAGISLAGQMVFHSVYGDETFLYSPHMIPMWLSVVGLGWHAPWGWARPVLLGLLPVLIASAAVNNGLLVVELFGLLESRV